ncbi:hypothetical protein BC833DRAFT_40573 [Globomyces pollinis-pini]|nr:hypothetical protein BC833DRAFT_40573 [Globomyces pollinis-pini]
MANSLTLANNATSIISAASLLISLVLDFKNRKTSGLSSPNGIIGLVMRTALLIWGILGPLLLSIGDKYVTEGGSVAEQRIAMTVVFSIIQMCTTIGAMGLLATFFYYWVSVSALLPKSKVVGTAKKLVDQYPLAVPIFFAVYYLIYLCFFFGPLLVWPGQQLLRYSFWRALCQATIQILTGSFLIPVFFYLIYALIRYIASKSIVRDSGDNSKFDKVAQALVRIICTNIALIVYLVLAPATLLVLDRTLIFQEIPLTHPLYVRRATSMGTAAQAILNLTGFSVSLIFLGKYIVVKKRGSSAGSSQKKSTVNASQLQSPTVKASEKM